MNQESLQTLVTHGLSAMKAGSMVAEKATAEIFNDATNPALKGMLEHGNEQSKKWADRIERALDESGGSADTNNAILEAHYKVSQEIRSNADDDFSRDLGIIASGQMALHYWIASFGTTRTYAEQLGLTETTQAMESCLEEAKAADLEMTEVASQIMGVQPQTQKGQSQHIQMQ